MPGAGKIVEVQILDSHFEHGARISKDTARACKRKDESHPRVAAGSGANYAVTSTPASRSLLWHISPSTSPPMRELKVTLLPRSARLWARMAEELPSVRAKPLARTSRSSGNSRGNP